MKAIRLHGRKGLCDLHFEDAPLPRLLPGDALVRVYATGITPTELEWDETYQNADGSPRIPSIPGHEVAGIVEAVASGVSDVRPGDAVYGLTDFPRDGAAAEFVAVRASNLAARPQSIDFCHAAAIALSGLTAWQAFFTYANLQPGQKSSSTVGLAGSAFSLCSSRAGAVRTYLLPRERKTRSFSAGSARSASSTTRRNASTNYSQVKISFSTQLAARRKSAPGKFSAVAER